MPIELPCPSSLLQRPRLRSLTAPRPACAFDDALKFPAWRRARARHLGTSSPRKRGPSGFGFKATGKSENHLQNQRLDTRLRGDDGMAKPSLSAGQSRSEEHTTAIQSVMRISSVDFCLKK